MNAVKRGLSAKEVVTIAISVLEVLNTLWYDWIDSQQNVYTRINLCLSFYSRQLYLRLVLSHARVF